MKIILKNVKSRIFFWLNDSVSQESNSCTKNIDLYSTDEKGMQTLCHVATCAIIKQAGDGLALRD